MRRLDNGRLLDDGLFVEWRDSNSILRDYMMTDDRAPEGVQRLQNLYDAIDRGDKEEAKKRFVELVEKWGGDDSNRELRRAKSFLEWEE